MTEQGNISEWLHSQGAITPPGLLRTGIRNIVLSALPGRLIDAALHHLDSGGKYLRGTLTLAAASAEGINDGDAWRIARACELLHNASLVHDDIIDGDEVRRSRPSVWRRYGITTAILLGDGFIGLAFSEIASVSDPANVANLSRLFSATLLTMIGGEVDGNANIDVSPLAGEDAFAIYRQICTEKTAPLFELPLVAVLTTARRPNPDVELGRTVMRHIGFAYQLLDDAKDSDRNHQAGVPVGTVGRTLLIERAIQHCRIAQELTVGHLHIPSTTVMNSMANALLVECIRVRT